MYITLPNRKSRLKWFRHVECKEDIYWNKCTMIETEELRQIGCP